MGDFFQTEPERSIVFHSILAMADDQSYPHQVEMYSSSEEEQSSEMDSSDMEQEQVEAVDFIDANIVALSDSNPMLGRSSPPVIAKKPETSNWSNGKKHQPVRGPRSLDVEVTGPTEDVRRFLGFKLLDTPSSCAKCETFTYTT